MGEGRILLVWQDNLLSGCLPDDAVDWVPSGRSITPLSPAPPSVGPGRMGLILLRLLCRRYRAVLLPVARDDWRAGSPAKRLLRRLVAAAVRSKAGAGLLRAVLVGRQPLLLLDRYCTLDLAREYIERLKPLRYLKAQLREADAVDPRIGVLPYWIHAHRYAVPAAGAKDVDLYFCADINSAPRRRVAEELGALERMGFRVLAETARQPLPTYMERLARAYLVVSPEGYGYHCFRHYEAMLAGAVPLVNRARPAVVTDLRDGEHAVLYDDEPGGLVRAAVRALENREELAARGRRLREWVVGTHSAPAVGQELLRQLGEMAAVPEQGPVAGSVQRLWTLGAGRIRERDGRKGAVEA